MATFPTDVAASQERATLSCAVDHVPDALLYKSTALETSLSAMTPSDGNLLHRKHNKQQAARLKHANVTPSPTLINTNSSPSTNSAKLQLHVRCPPAKMATFPTDVAATKERATLSCAVDHVPCAVDGAEAAVVGGAAVANADVDGAAAAVVDAPNTDVDGAATAVVDLPEV
jgi:hypothetical protein